MIASARYTDAAAAVAIVLDDGSEWHTDASLPPDTELRRALADWIAEGGVIAPYVAPPEPVPSITRRQLRLWLLANGKADADVRAVIATIPDPTQQATALIEWEDATTYERGHPLIASLGAALGFTPEQMDAGFREASAL